MMSAQLVRRSAVAASRRAIAVPHRGFAAAAPSIPASLVKQLREATGAPMMECKNALSAEGVNGNIEKAIEWLRKKGMAAASKKAGRVAAQGLIAASTHESELAGVLVEVNCETDFVSRNDMFKELTARAGATALATIKEEGGSLSSPLFPLKAGSVSQAEGDVKALVDTQLSAGAASSALAATGINTSSPVSTVLLELIGKIRENMVLRRVGALVLPKPANPSESIAFVSQYIHNSAGPGIGSIGVLLGVNAAGKADVVSKPETRAALKELGKKLAMHVAGAKPLYATRDAVPQDELEKERSILRSQAASSGKPQNIIDKMVEGRLGKFYGETVLLDQPYILSEEGAPVRKALEEQAKKLGLASITVPGFLHYVVGASPAAAKEAAAAAAGEGAAPAAELK